MSPLSTRLAVLGAGKMGGALVRGWVRSGVLTSTNIRIHNRRPESTARFADEVGATAASSPAECVQEADVLLLGVKPWQIVPILDEIRDYLPPSCLILSVAAGVSLLTLEKAAPTSASVLRAMPNTPALVGAAATAFCRGIHATDAHAALAQSLFGAVGSVYEVTESQIDAVIGVSGSGVAYFYLLIEALTDGGVRAGLPRDVARPLAAQTALGAARMLLETGEHPAVLKDAVTTPGGTTIAALEVLERAGIRGTMMEAVLAAQKRAREMG